MNDAKMLVKKYDENGNLMAKLALAPADVEEAIVRCGWMILNDAENVTEAHLAEISRCERDGASSTNRTTAEAIAWWKARRVS